jgi:hypothetical protein
MHTNAVDDSRSHVSVVVLMMAQRREGNTDTVAFPEKEQRCGEDTKKR